METVVGIFIFLGVLITGATFTGQSEELCKAMGGTYRAVPPPENVCPGGKFRNLISRPTTQPQK